MFLSFCVAVLLLRQLSLEDSSQTEDWTLSPSCSNRFYQVPISREQVHFVDSPESLRRCRDAVLQVGKRLTHCWRSPLPPSLLSLLLFFPCVHRMEVWSAWTWSGSPPLAVAPPSRWR